MKMNISMTSFCSFKRKSELGLTSVSQLLAAWKFLMSDAVFRSLLSV